jgi:hypothetical protein
MMVRSTRVLRSFSGGLVSGSVSNTIRSASLPASIVPLIFSSQAQLLGLRVHCRLQLLDGVGFIQVQIAFALGDDVDVGIHEPGQKDPTFEVEGPGGPIFSGDVGAADGHNLTVLDGNG